MKINKLSEMFEINILNFFIYPFVECICWIFSAIHLFHMFQKFSQILQSKPVADPNFSVVEQPSDHDSTCECHRKKVKYHTIDKTWLKASFVNMN